MSVSDRLDELARLTLRIATELDSVEREYRNEQGERLRMAEFARSSLEWSAGRMSVMARECE